MSEFTFPQSFGRTFIADQRTWTVLIALPYLLPTESAHSWYMPECSVFYLCLLKPFITTALCGTVC